MIKYNDIYFENKKAYLLYKSLMEYKKDLYINFKQYSIITEEDIRECWQFIDNKVSLLPQYNVKKWKD